jgi:hypothetical protein
MRRALSLITACVLLVAMILVCPQAGYAQAPADVAVAVNSEVPIDNLTLSELRRIVLGDREFWPGGARVTLLLRAPVAHERDVVLKTVCLMSEAQFRQHWIAKVFRADTAVGPKIVYTGDMAMTLVGQTPGALAFVSAPAGGRTLKVIRIDGKLPGEPGYPLR